MFITFKSGPFPASFYVRTSYNGTVKNADGWIKTLILPRCRKSPICQQCHNHKFCLFFFKNGPILAFFLIFSSFSHSNSNYIYKLINVNGQKIVFGVLAIRTRGRRMVGTDETTELWRPPKCCLLLSVWRFRFRIPFSEVF